MNAGNIRPGGFGGVQSPAHGKNEKAPVYQEDLAKASRPGLRVLLRGGHVGILVALKIAAFSNRLPFAGWMTCKLILRFCP